MAIQTKLPNVSNSSEQSYSSGTLKLKKFELKNLNSTTASHLIPIIGKKTTGKSWIYKDILYNNNTTNGNQINSNKETSVDEITNLIKTNLSL